jgi:hypothetical protein
MRPRFDPASDNPWERYEARKQGIREKAEGSRDYERLVRQLCRELGL